MKLIVFLFSFFVGVSARAEKIWENEGSFFVNCKFENRVEACLVDTGAYSAGVRGYKPFDEYPSLGKTKSKGVSGALVESELIQVKSVEVGKLKIGPAIVATLPKDFSHSVLGLEFFEKQSRVSFNFSKNEIHKKRFRNFCAQDFVLRNKLIQVPLVVGEAHIFAGWDTGSSLTVVSRQYVEARPGEFKFVRELANGRDSSGAPMSARLYKIKSLSICGKLVTDLEVVAVDFAEAKKDMPNFPDLFIGANLMTGREWAFDFQRGRWFFE